ncbi:MAG TPA: phosphoenolpyruvate--protein phosphotransferase [Solirubrobacteraceae bacterium]
MSRTLRGLGVSPGEASGPVGRLEPPQEIPAQSAEVADVAVELTRAEDALGAVASELERRAGLSTGAASEVLSAQAMIAGDPALHDGVSARISGGRDAVHAVEEAFAEHRGALESLGGYFAERASDLDDLRDRAVAVLLGRPMPGVPDPGHPYVLVAVELAPADTATLDPEKVVAIVTERGGPTGHTAILAKQLGIPAVTACPEAVTLADGRQVLVNGVSGEVIADPNDDLVAQALYRREQLARRRAGARGPGRTADGHPIPLLANIGGTGDLAGLGADECEGVGLLRTEFLFLDRTVAPSNEEQQQSYAEVFSAFAGRRVVVRTLDVGADKPLAYLPRPEEPNPALGVRGLRLVRSNPELLDEQLDAIKRAARGSEAEVWVMAPMVSTVEEAREFAARARDHEIAHVGVMIEVPSAAICAHEVLAEVDFASIGTNDLAQYALATDRLAGELSDLLDPWQPALLRLVSMTAQAGQALGRSVGVCGEAASDPLLALVLVGLGITSLSMAKASLPDVRAALAEHPLDRCRQLARDALEAGSAAAARSTVAKLASRSESPAPEAALAGGVSPASR